MLDGDLLGQLGQMPETAAQAILDTITDADLMPHGMRWHADEASAVEDLRARAKALGTVLELLDGLLANL